MKYLLILLLPLIAYAEKSYESFIVKVEEEKISVITPKKSKDIVTIIVENKTFERIISEIKTDKKVLKRFTLEPEGQKGANFSLTVDFSKVKNLFYVPISPPFQAAPLNPKGKNYEIP
tara:strand:- start:66219 stop:66572 length:354 start_codon:yes stop_codon:yes gene_type:complete